jgi:uncharacterized protein YbcI
MSDSEQRTTGERLAEISTALVSLHRKYYGKGPVKAKSFIVDDTVLCLLQGGLTIVERTLVESGDSKVVYDMRHSFQSAMKHEFQSAVEAATGRRVIAYMSQVHLDPDISAELFVLESAGDAVAAQHEAVQHEAVQHEEDLSERAS